MSISILIVDDEKGIRDSLAAYLKLEEYKAETAQDGWEALDKLRESTFNVVLLDINMPGLDGIDTLQSIKAIDFSIQVIMMTAFSTFEKTMQCMEHGATDYILKPFDNLEEILRLVKISEERLDRWRRNINESISLRQQGTTEN